MKNIFSYLVIFFLMLAARGQEVSVEKSIFNIQTGILECG